MYLVGSNCTLRNSTFDSNVAAKAGGAIYVKFSSLDVGSTKFLNNTAPVGGAVTVYSNSNVTFTNSSLLTNTARPVKAEALQDQLSKGSYYMLGVGGALYVEQSSVSITRSKVLGNRAVMDGGECGNARGYNRGQQQQQHPPEVHSVVGSLLCFVVQSYFVL
jgi:predicted outer membrane repeat protein